VVADQTSHIQILEHDRLVLANEPSRKLVQVISAPVCYPRVDARDPGTHAAD
jgi:hypothetical protein